MECPDPKRLWRDTPGAGSGDSVTSTTGDNFSETGAGQSSAPLSPRDLVSLQTPIGGLTISLPFDFNATMGGNMTSTPSTCGKTPACDAVLLLLGALVIWLFARGKK